MTEKYIIKCTENSFQAPKVGIIRYVCKIKTYKFIIKSWEFCDEFYPEHAHKFYFKQAAEKIINQLNLIQPETYTYSVIPFLPKKYYSKKELNNLCY
jgi:hypothetical protein